MLIPLSPIAQREQEELAIRYIQLGARLPSFQALFPQLKKRWLQKQFSAHRGRNSPSGQLPTDDKPLFLPQRRLHSTLFALYTRGQPDSWPAAKRILFGYLHYMHVVCPSDPSLAMLDIDRAIHFAKSCVLYRHNPPTIIACRKCGTPGLVPKREFQNRYQCVNCSKRLLAGRNKHVAE